MKLHAYQRADIGRIIAAWRRHRTLLYVLPPSAGKTVVGSHVTSLMLRRRLRVMICVPSAHLVDQWMAWLLKAGVAESKIGVIRGADARVRPTAPLQICGVQTLTTRARYPQADVVLMDEAHHALAPSWLKLLDHQKKAKVLGLTGSPVRIDGRAMGEVFSGLVVGAKPSELIERGHIERPRIWSVTKEHLPTLAGVKIRYISHGLSMVDLRQIIGRPGQRLVRKHVRCRYGPSRVGKRVGERRHGQAS